MATAYNLSQRFPERRVVILEKEAGLAQHQTGHNSGVLHSGIYYKPGSLKAINCREGKKAMEAFCAAEGIDYETCGKVIVATNERELPALNDIYQRGQANGVQCAICENSNPPPPGSRPSMCRKRASSTTVRSASVWPSVCRSATV